MLATPINSYAWLFSKTEKKENSLPKNIQSIKISISNIPKYAQSLFIALHYNSQAFEIHSVSESDLVSKNIVSLTTGSKSTTESGVGLLKIDSGSFPKDLEFQLYMKKNDDGNPDVMLLNVSLDSALLAKGTKLKRGVISERSTPKQIEVKQGIGRSLTMNNKKINIVVKRDSKNLDKFYIPISFDTNLFEIKINYSCNSEDSGVKVKILDSVEKNSEIIEVSTQKISPKNFSICLNLIPNEIGKTDVVVGLPQVTPSRIIGGPIVMIGQ